MPGRELDERAGKIPKAGAGTAKSRKNNAPDR